MINKSREAEVEEGPLQINYNKFEVRQEVPLICSPQRSEFNNTEQNLGIFTFVTCIDLENEVKRIFSTAHF